MVEVCFSTLHLVAHHLEEACSPWGEDHHQEEDSPWVEDHHREEDHPPEEEDHQEEAQEEDLDHHQEDHLMEEVLCQEMGGTTDNSVSPLERTFLL